MYDKPSSQYSVFNKIPEQNIWSSHMIISWQPIFQTWIWKKNSHHILRQIEYMHFCLPVKCLLNAARVKNSCNPHLKHVLFAKKVQQNLGGGGAQCYMKCSKYLIRSAMHAFRPFLMFNATLCTLSSVMLEMHGWIFCLGYSNMCGLFLLTFSFKNPQW